MLEQQIGRPLWRKHMLRQLDWSLKQPAFSTHCSMTSA
jgi:hypothetical protein